MDETELRSIHSPGTGKKRNTSSQVKISLMNIIFSYKKITSTLLSELLLCLLSLKTNQVKIILLPKRHIWGYYVLLHHKTVTLVSDIFGS